MSSNVSGLFSRVTMARESAPMPSSDISEDEIEERSSIRARIGSRRRVAMEVFVVRPLHQEVV
jgi:hypothetical protein